MTVNVNYKPSGSVSITKPSEKVVTSTNVQEVVTVKGGIRGEQGIVGPTGPSGPAGATGPEGISIGSTPPVDTDTLWLDTSVSGTLDLASVVLSDFVSPYSYIGVAYTGAATSDAVWKVTRINTTLPITSTTAYPIAWTNRLIASYT